MATGTASDFKVYPEQFYGGMAETVAQQISLFNEASRGAIVLEARQLRGHYEYESFIKDLTLVAHRDVTSVSAIAAAKLTQGEFISVKVNRRIGPVENTGDAWRKISSDPAEMSFKLGEMAGERKMKDMVNTGILCLETALAGQANVVHDISATSAPGITHTALSGALRKFGDAAENIVVWVGHSTAYFDLMEAAIAANVYDIGAIAIKEGTNRTLGRPFIVTDAPALTDANGSLDDTYNTLGLVAGAVRVIESEDRDLLFEKVGGLGNLVYRYQAEYAYNVQVKGFAWDVSAGGSDPDDTELGTTGNWDKAATSDKHLAGVRLVTE